MRRRDPGFECDFCVILWRGFPHSRDMCIDFFGSWQGRWASVQPTTGQILAGRHAFLSFPDVRPQWPPHCHDLCIFSTSCMTSLPSWLQLTDADGHSRHTLLHASCWQTSSRAVSLTLCSALDGELSAGANEHGPSQAPLSSRDLCACEFSHMPCGQCAVSENWQRKQSEHVHTALNEVSILQHGENMALFQQASGVDRVTCPVGIRRKKLGGTSCSKPAVQSNRFSCFCLLLLLCLDLVPGEDSCTKGLFFLKRKAFYCAKLPSNSTKASSLPGS